MSATKGVSFLYKAIDMNIGFIGAGNLALYMAQGFVRSGMFYLTFMINATNRLQLQTAWDGHFLFIFLYEIQG